MATWAEFAGAAPEIASSGERLLRRGEIDEGLLATVRRDGLPRIHPVYVKIVDGRLYTFVLPSAKRTDLEEDGRYSLHAHQDPAVPHEFEVRGHATVVRDEGRRARVAGEWYFTTGEADTLFELGIESALLGTRASADDWPPRYTTWKAATAA